MVREGLMANFYNRFPGFPARALVAVLALFLASAACANADPVSDMNVLLDFKNLLNDTTGALESWKESAPVCDWYGVLCDPGSNVVRGLNISSAGVEGPLDPGLCNIPTLEILYVDNNYLYGIFPEEMFKCTALVSLNVSQNYLEGPLPDGFHVFKKLLVLDLSYCYFSDSLPPSLGQLSQLQFLDLSTNNFTSGGIPSSYENMTSLRFLHAAWNFLLEGPFLSDFGGLTNLTSLQVQQCRLTGILPQSIGLLTELTYLDVSNNSLYGQIPESVGNLTNLTFFDVADNQFVGEVPQSLAQLTRCTHFFLYNNLLIGRLPTGLGKFVNMSDFDVSNNSFVGPIPPDMVELKQLVNFHVQQNSLSGAIPAGFADLVHLREFIVFENRLNGSIPAQFGDRCVLSRFDVSTNELTGVIPPNLCNGGELRELELFRNSFTGRLPDTYGDCPALARIRIHENSFSGPLPLGIWANPILDYLEISSNRFEGTIPAEIANASLLRTLRMNNNKFRGAIPPQIGDLVHLVVLEATNNQLGGPIPTTIGNMGNLTSLLLAYNQISGPIPSELGDCRQLANLNLSNNKLSGPIPSSLASLTFLTLLDVSSNQLTGAIPPELGQATVISSFNFSDNAFSGPLPPAFQSGVFADDFAGNPNLCGAGLSSQKSCSKSKRVGFLPWIVGGTFLTAAAVFILGSCLFYRKCSKHRRKERQKDAGPWRLKSFQKVGFSEGDVLTSLDEDNVIGEGGAGKVYKATLPDGQIVAVKKLWTNAKGSGNRNDHGFKAEVETLGKIRHRNIVKLLCCCSNRESNLLVYEYMENGSLGELLHSNKSSLLDWASRFKIALGSAQGLAYLHHDCVPQILHRDVKSNNILLDEDFEPHVADFGLAKILEKFSRGDSMSVVAGSYGYIAPEYGYTLKVSEKSDIYSFGVVLMELLTGKRPIEPEFGDGVDLVKWVTSKLQTKDGLQEVLDRKLGGASQEGMIRVLMLALRCTDGVPGKRPSMQQVVEYLRQADPQNLQKDDKDWKDAQNGLTRTDSTLDAVDVKLLVK